MSETWKPIPGYAGYEVSDLGRVRSWRTRWTDLAPEPHLLTPVRMQRGGYHSVGLRANGATRLRVIHQLVLEAFVGPRPEGMTDVRHLNGVPDDNRLSNLAYGTHAENMADIVQHRTHPYHGRTTCKNNHEFTPENTRIRYKNGRPSRACRTCQREHRRAYDLRRRASELVGGAS